MFKQVSPQYACDETAGISVEITGPYSIRYANNDYVTTLATEPLKEGERYSVCLYVSDLQTWETPDGQEMTSDEKQDVENHVKAALTALDISAEVA